MKPACASLRRARPLLGTFVEIAVGGALQSKMEDAVEAAFTVVGEVQRLMSFHDTNSDLARLNREAAAHAVTVHPWTFEVLEAALDLQHRSDGIFDIAVAPVLQHFGWLPHHAEDRPVATIARPRELGIELLPDRCVRFSSPNIAIDLGGIAKGFAVDQAINVLRGDGMPQGLVNAGGDLAAFGPQAATVAIRDPRDPRRILCQVEVECRALASSGGQHDPSQRRVAVDSAVIDPRTLRPARAALGATVCAPSCMIADALTKIVMITGEFAAPMLADYGASAMFVSRGGDLRITREWQSAVRLAA